MIKSIWNWIKSPQPEMLPLQEGGLRTERDYQLHCNQILQGKVEYRLPDATRVDILPDTLAIEVDFAKKWYEAVGQSCHYARWTDRAPAILLIVTDKDQEKYIKAAKEATKNTQVKVGTNYYPITMLIYRDF